MDVGYGLEGTLTDARVRRLLEEHLATAFSRGEYERGFDAFIKAVRDDLGGDEAIARALVEQVHTPDPPLSTQVASALRRTPRVLSATLANYLEGDISTRIAILVMSSVVLGIVAMGLALAANTVWRVFTLKAKVRERNASGGGSALTTSVFEIVAGVGGFAICFAMVAMVLLFAESRLTRNGSFSGAGAAIVWPARTG
jgi:uncharacterized membrane protein YgcG